MSSAENHPKRVVIYTTPTCPFCRMAKEYFRQHKIEYVEVDVANDPIAAKAMIARTGQIGVPQIFVGKNRVIIGFDKDELDHLFSLS